MLQYLISFERFAAHEISVQLDFIADSEESILRLPAWIPGSYMIRDFARNMVQIAPKNEAHELTKLDKQSWRLSGIKTGEKVSLNYRVYAFDLSVRSAYLDSGRAYFNGTSLLLRPDTQRTNAVDIELRPVPSKPEWKVATTWPAIEVDHRGFGRYRAVSYEEALDYPVEISAFSALDFAVDDVPHRMVFTDAKGADLEKIGSQVAVICAEHAAMFGELPIQQFLFQTLVTADGYGGLEHRDSTSLVCRRNDLPFNSDQPLTADQRTYLALCSHEYFHLWNVKRIRPAELAKSDLLEEAHTELLWWFEGATSYYDELALPRAGVVSFADYAEMFAQAISRYWRNPGRFRQSIAASSFDAWTKFYKQDENAPNAIVSYYNKGGLVVFGLDHWIRTHTQDRLCLDDLTRLLWQRYGKTEIGVPERGIEGLVAELTGADPSAFFAAYVYGTDELPLAEWLADFGVLLTARVAKSPEDNGGVVNDLIAPTAAPIAELGARVSAQGDMLQVDRVLAGSSAENAGLAARDILLAIDGERVTAKNWLSIVRRYQPGQSASLTYFRRDLLQEATIEWLAAPLDTADLCWLPADHLSETVAARRRAWLSSSKGRVSDT